MAKRISKAREEQTSYGDDSFPPEDHAEMRDFLRERRVRAYLARIRRKILGDYDREEVRKYLEQNVLSSGEKDILSMARDLANLRDLGVRVSDVRNLGVREVGEYYNRLIISLRRDLEV